MVRDEGLEFVLCGWHCLEVEATTEKFLKE